MFTDEIIKLTGGGSLEFYLPKITVLGKRAVVIEGHRGVVFFSSDEAKFRLKNCMLSVTGEKLEVKNLTSSDALVSGAISGLSYA